ncbi:MAG TPA: hypothetical protein VJA20_03285 [Candidatus Nanoarchaeia archaeon]|nr:hypothetical protein [Candidatus Nanoarchaeia archaeon]
MVMKNKNGWTSVIEVFVSILLIAGIMVVVVNSNTIQKPKISEQIYKEQTLTLKIIQMDDTLRADILNNQLSRGITSTIRNTIPDYLLCEAKICDLNSECILDKTVNKEVYAKSVLITTDMVDYSPKELKLFCWKK